MPQAQPEFSPAAPGGLRVPLGAALGHRDTEPAGFCNYEPGQSVQSSSCHRDFVLGLPFGIEGKNTMTCLTDLFNMPR